MPLEVKVHERPRGYSRIFEAHYLNFIGKKIESFVSTSDWDDDPDPDKAYDITIKFTDGTELRIQEVMQAGQIGLTYKGE